MVKDQLLLKTDVIVEALRPYHPQKVILFGSWARREADEESDLDLILVKDTSARFMDRLKDVYALLSDFGAVDILVYTPQEVAQMLTEGNSFLEDALAEGIVLYEEKTDC
jgi:predicted nucleotidyltransferase